jgi:hypothetical protein
MKVGTKPDPAFSTAGFSNWKKAIITFKSHESSAAHKDAFIVFQASVRPSISNLLCTSLEKDKKKHRESLLNQLKAIRFLLRQGLAVRNDHSGGSNLSIMLQHVLDDNVLIKKDKYQSPEIVNELIELMAHKVLRSVLSEINSRRWFALMADETRDISNREQLVLCIRSVSDSYVVYEDMISLSLLESTTAIALHACIKDNLLRMGIMFDKCRGQVYDGASSFQGHINGVATKFKEENPAAISVHCMAHCLNLILQEVSRSSKPIKDALNFSMELIQLIKLSPKRQALFEAIQQQQGSQQNASIRTLCPTRWTVRAGAMQAIILHYQTLQETMEKSSHGSDDCSRRANGILALMERFSTFFGLKLSYLLFSITEQCSVHLQRQDGTTEDGYLIIDTCLKALKSLRADSKFLSFFTSVKNEAEGLCDLPVLPRQRKVPRRIDDGAAGHVFDSVEEFYRKEYFQAIESIIGALEKRFQQPGFSIVRSAEKLLLDSANGKEVNIPLDIRSIYKSDIDFEKLTLQLNLLHDTIKSVPIEGVVVTQVTKLRTICDVFEAQQTLKLIFSEIHKLLLIILTVPITTATAERSFSALRRIKNYLRNSMSQQRLNHCIILNIHRELTDRLQLTDIAQEFIGRNDRRIQFFGNF